MKDQQTIEAIKQRYTCAAAPLDERGRRAVAAAEALTLGWGGITAVARATGLSRTVSQSGIKETRGTLPSAPAGRVRRPGGGRKPIRATDPTVGNELERLVEPTTRGDPASPLRWTCKSVRKLAAELPAQGHQTSHRLGGGMLHQLR